MLEGQAMYFLPPDCVLQIAIVALADETGQIQNSFFAPKRTLRSLPSEIGHAAGE
jgi:hypothetical protein